MSKKAEIGGSTRAPDRTRPQRVRGVETPRRIRGGPPVPCCRALYYGYRYGPYSGTGAELYKKAVTGPVGSYA